MKALFKDGVFIGYTMDENYSVPGVIIATLPADWDEADAQFAKVVKGKVVIDLGKKLAAAKNKRKAAIKAEAEVLISATDWRLDRAREREAAGWATLAEVDAVLAEREAIRRSSDAAEAAVDALTDVASVLAFAWSVDVPVPAPRRQTHQQFLARFADTEMQAILAAQAVQPAVAAWLEKFRLAGYVNLADPATIAGVQALEIAGLLGNGRAAEVLA